MNDSQIILKNLEHSPIFKHCDQATLAAFCDQGSLLSIEKGNILFVHEEPANKFYLIIEGWIKLFRETLDGTQAVIDILPAGQMFGETSIFQHDLYPYSAEAVESCRIISLPLPLLKAEIGTNLKLVTEMLSYMAHTKRLQEKEIEHLVVQNAPQRIGCFLLRLTNQKRSGAVEIQLPYDKSLVAARLGMQAETFSRALSKLIEATGLKIKGATIELDDVQRLVHFSCAACTAEFPCKDLNQNH